MGEWSEKKETDFSYICSMHQRNFQNQKMAELFEP